MAKVVVECEICKKKLERWPSNIKRAKYGNFCGRDCLGVYRTQKLVGEFGANYRLGMKRNRSYQLVEAAWHPNSRNNYVYLHRLIAESKLGRFLNDDEVVHHKDHNPRNNHWDNLEVMTQAEHAREHTSERKRDNYGRF